jgi:hypothetical protein
MLSPPDACSGVYPELTEGFQPFSSGDGSAQTPSCRGKNNAHQLNKLMGQLGTWDKPQTPQNSLKDPKYLRLFIDDATQSEMNG